MRTLAITQNITLDGSIEILDDWFDPQARGLGDMSDLQEEVAAAERRLRRVPARAADLRGLRGPTGRTVTDDTTGTSAYLDAVDKYVVSSTLTEPGWENTTVLAGDPVEEVRCAQGVARLRHRGHRQHHARPTLLDGRPGRRGPAVHLPGRAGPRPPAVPGRVPARSASAARARSRSGRGSC